MNHLIHDAPFVPEISDIPPLDGPEDHPAHQLPVTTRRGLILLGVGTLGAGLAAGTGAASAADPKLRKGSKGAAVTRLQKKLGALGYWCGSADGSFGHLTQQAVWALQKVAGLGRDGVVGAKTWAALHDGKKPKSRITSGTSFDVDLDRQILICYTGGRVKWTFNTSTGSGERYYSGGRWKTATTPKGKFAMYRLYSSGWQSGPLGSMYRPGYYDRGWAIHGSNSIPPYPASHGCARISVAAADLLWSQKWIVKGRRVLVR